MISFRTIAGLSDYIEQKGHEDSMKFHEGNDYKVGDYVRCRSPYDDDGFFEGEISEVIKPNRNAKENWGLVYDVLDDDGRGFLIKEEDMLGLTSQYS